MGSGLDPFLRQSRAIGPSDCATWVASNSPLVLQASLVAGRAHYAPLGGEVDGGWFDFAAAMGDEILGVGKTVTVAAREDREGGDASL